MKEKIKALFSDSMWSICGLMLMNIVAQFIVYPIFNSHFGENKYGSILYLLSLMNIFSISLGISCNYARMRASATQKTTNSVYTCILLCGCVATIPLTLLISRFGNTDMTPLESIAFALLMCVTMWRFYADVEYKLHLNYKGYFLYYCAISVGYLIGVLLFVRTGIWPLVLLPGELLGLSMVIWRGSVLKPDGMENWTQVRPIIQVVATLFSAEVISALIFNGDRILLNYILDGAAVTTYYLASLLGKTLSLVTTPLNGVIVGYLARYDGRLTRKIMHTVSASSLAVIIVGTMACTVASHILIRILYPHNYLNVRDFFLIANLTQVVYFVSNVVTVVLLRFSSAKYQMVINAVYAAAFVMICIPMTLVRGMNGFTVGLLLTSLARIAVALFLGYFDTFKQKGR